MAAVLFDEGPLSRSDPFSGQSESWPDRGPGTVDSPVVGGALGGAAPSLGRARCLAVRGGYVNPASGVPIGALAPPTAPPPRAVRAREIANLGRIGAARMRKCGCLKFELE